MGASVTEGAVDAGTVTVTVEYRRVSELVFREAVAGATSVPLLMDGLGKDTNELADVGTELAVAGPATEDEVLEVLFASSTGQTVVPIARVLVTMRVDSAGQLPTPGAQLVIVILLVVKMVLVVYDADVVGRLAVAGLIVVALLVEGR